MEADYHIPSAASYDWSSFPTVRADTSVATWMETLVTYATPARVAVGINRVEKSSDDSKIFFAGALLGIGGAAVVAAIQEALHLWDQAKTRT
jgi:hypothetical protein